VGNDGNGRCVTCDGYMCSYQFMCACLTTNLALLLLLLLLCVQLVTPCGHLFCRECILACLADSGLCPMCRTPAEQAECKPWQPVADPAAEAGTAERAGPSTASTPAGAPGTPCGDASDMDLDVDQEGWITAAAAAAAAEAEAAAAAAVAGAVAEAGAAAPVGEMPDAAAAAAAAAEAGEGPGGQGIVVGGGRNPGTIRCTSKLRALMADLTAALAADASTKALVFGQYGGSMGALEDLLTAAGVRYATIKGHMTRTRRSEAIKVRHAPHPAAAAAAAAHPDGHDCRHSAQLG
jgi:hypothetical protein